MQAAAAPSKREQPPAESYYWDKYVKKFISTAHTSPVVWQSPFPLSAASQPAQQQGWSSAHGKQLVVSSCPALTFLLNSPCQDLRGARPPASASLVARALFNYVLSQAIITGDLSLANTHTHSLRNPRALVRALQYFAPQQQNAVGAARASHFAHPYGPRVPPRRSNDCTPRGVISLWELIRGRLRDPQIISLSLSAALLY